LKKVSFKADRCTACGSCSVACAIVHSRSKDVNRAADEWPAPRARIDIQEKGGKLVIVRCRNCKKAKCIDACEPKAISRNAEGYVLFNETLCNGCWKCIEACPFKAVVRSGDENKALKCDSCLDRKTPACVDACHTEALKVEEGAAE